MNNNARWPTSICFVALLALATLGAPACGGKGTDSAAAGASGATGSSASAGTSSASAGTSSAGSRAASAGSGAVGGAVNGAGAGAGSTGIFTCDPTPLTDWMPHWTPPVAPIARICTPRQISTELELCAPGPSYNRAACSAFEVDPGNQSCLNCLFTTTDQSQYGAVTIDPLGYWQTNISGCIAEVDGDTSESGCGAKDQAYSDCLRAACESSCWLNKPDAAYADCRTKAAAGACHAEQLADVCAKSPKYAVCNNYPVFGDYFTAIGSLFCVTGDDNAAEGGAAGATQ